MLAPITTLIPHRPPLQWIDGLLEYTDTTASAMACFGPGHFALSDGAILETALVECMAQTVAAALGARAQGAEVGGGKSEAGGGMLAAVANFRIHVIPSVGKPIRIDVRELKRLGPMLLVSGVVSCEGKLIASGELSLYA